MSFIDIIIPLSFIVIIIKHVIYMKALIMPTRKTYAEIITALFSVIIFVCIIYFYANTWIHYVTGVLGIFMFVSILIKQGINSKGFRSTYRYKDSILWNEIERVIVIRSKDIKVRLEGGFMEQTFHFKKSDYDKVITILKENLPKQAQVQTIFNK